MVRLVRNLMLEVSNEFERLGQYKVVGCSEKIDSDKPLIVLSTGGPAGVWQSALVESLISDTDVFSDGVQWLGGSAGAVNIWILSRYMRQAIKNVSTKKAAGVSTLAIDELRLLIRKHPLTKVWSDIIFPFMTKGSTILHTLKFLLNKGFILKTGDLYSNITKHLSFIDSDVINDEYTPRLPYMSVVAYDMNASEGVVAKSSDPYFSTVTKGSAAIPFIFKEVALGQRLLVDIGVVDPLILLTMIELVSHDCSGRGTAYFVVAQEPGLYKDFFSPKWFNRSVSKSIKWIKTSVFDSLVSAHLRLIYNMGYNVIQLDTDLALSFDSQGLVIDTAVAQGAKLGHELADKISS